MAVIHPAREENLIIAERHCKVFAARDIDRILGAALDSFPFELVGLEHVHVRWAYFDARVDPLEWYLTGEEEYLVLVTL